VARAPSADILRQIEYAAKAVDGAGTALGMRCTDGILLAVEKLVPTKLLVPSAKGASLNRRIAAVDRHVGLVRVWRRAEERERERERERRADRGLERRGCAVAGRDGKREGEDRGLE
jgi:20S proteasome subunit alpha 7